jgi:hypothetical protein
MAVVDLSRDDLKGGFRGSILLAGTRTVDRGGCPTTSRVLAAATVRQTPRRGAGHAGEKDDARALDGADKRIKLLHWVFSQHVRDRQTTLEAE